MKEWRVIENFTGSDHRYVMFQLQVTLENALIITYGDRVKYVCLIELSRTIR